MSCLKTAVLMLAIAALGNSAMAQDNSKPEPIDGASRPLRDSVLDQMIGHWQVSRTMGGSTTACHVASGYGDGMVWDDRIGLPAFMEAVAFEYAPHVGRPSTAVRPIRASQSIDPG